MANIACRQLYKTYDQKTAVLQPFDLDIDDGEFIVLLGPSGCGKSTLLRMIAGLEDISGGELHIAGAVVNDLPARARNVAMVFQNYALYPHMTVYDNIAFGLRRLKVPDDEIERRVREVAAILSLDSLLDRKPRAMSGGQQQRTAIARAMIKTPQVFLFDEPLSNLDAKLREEARAFLRELIVRLGLSALMVTHDQGEAMAISDRILLLNNGKIEQQGTPQSMYETPDTLFTAEFMGSNNRLPGKVLQRDGGAVRLQVDGATMQGVARGAHVGTEVTTMIRVEEVKISAAQVDNAIELPLLTCMYLGDRWECLFQRGGADNISLRAYSRHKLEAGKYWLHMPADKLWVF